MLEERLIESVDKDELRRLKEIYLSGSEPRRWDAFVKNFCWRIGLESSLGILMFLQRYTEVADLIVKNSDSPFIDKEGYARKLAVLDKTAAQKVYWHLASFEAEKFKTSNHYPRFGHNRQPSALASPQQINKYLLDIKTAFPPKRN